MTFELLLQKVKKIKTELRSVPLVELPLGATEDRVCGTLDIERALHDGVKAFEPGVLAKANRGILYIDEVNLLDDHLVDVLLDSAASGWNTVEREGLSLRHPARFVLVGSGNPEEGELRPQLLDRFGMYVEVKTEKDPALRVKIVEERAAYGTDPVRFLEEAEPAMQRLRDIIATARWLLPEITTAPQLRHGIARICSRLNLDGLRGDIVTNYGVKALCAYNAAADLVDEWDKNDKSESPNTPSTCAKFISQPVHKVLSPAAIEKLSVSVQDIEDLVPLALRHRLRKDPLSPIDSGQKVATVFATVFPSRTIDDIDLNEVQ